MNALVLLGQRRVVEVALAQEGEVLGAGVDVVLLGADVGDADRCIAGRAGQHLCPQPGAIVVGDGDVDDAGVGHLEQVLRGQVWIRLDHVDRALARGHQAPAELAQVQCVAAAGQDLHRASGKVIRRGDARDVLVRDQQFVDLVLLRAPCSCALAMNVNLERFSRS